MSYAEEEEEGDEGEDVGTWQLVQVGTRKREEGVVKPRGHANQMGEDNGPGQVGRFVRRRSGGRGRHACLER